MSGDEESRAEKYVARPADVESRIAELAAQIAAAYKSEQPLFVCLLRGAVPFAARLMTEITKLDPEFHPELDYMSVSAYGDNRQAGAPKLHVDLSSSTTVAGRKILLIDDTLDTGATTIFTRNMLLERGAVSVDLVVLVQKKKQRLDDFEAKFVGFESPESDWLIGMGLDNAATAKEAYRWSDFVKIVN